MMNCYGQKRFYYDLGSFLLPMVVVSIVFACLGIAPFGAHNLLISDMGTQYVAWLTQFRHVITTGQFSFYSFSLSLGDNAFPLVAYYMLSPFNLILFFFPASQVPLAVTYIILLKVGSIGLSTAYYLRRVYHNTNWSNLLFSSIFALSGFVATYFYDIMWLDALILLPLVTLGLRLLVAGRDSRLYFFALWATIITNYYLGYMTCLFSLCYFIYLQFDQTPRRITWRIYWRTHRRLIGHYLAISILSGLSSLVVLYPTLLGMLRTSKQSLYIKAFLPLPQFGPEALAQLGMNAADYPARLEHDPSIYLGSLALLLCLGFFTAKNIGRRHKWALGGLLATLAISMFITLFNTIWHMLQQPNGFPFRNAYFFSFIVLLCAYESWQAHTFAEQRPLLRNLLIALSLLAIGYVTAIIAQPIVRRSDALASYYVSPLFWLISSLGLICAWWLLKRRSHGQRWLVVLSLTALTLLELGANFYFGLAPAKLGNQARYQRNFTIEQRYFKKIQQTNAFYRVDNQNSLLNAAYGEVYNNYNDPLLFNSYGIDLYSSTLNESTRLTLQRLGFYSKNERRISSAGSTELTNTLFAVRYLLSMTPHDYDLITLPNALPLGFAANQSLLNVTLKPHEALSNQNHLWQGITGRKTDYFRSVEVQQATVKQAVDHYNYTFTLRPKTNGPIYMYLPHVPIDSANIRVNQTKKRTKLSVSSEAVLPLGRFHEGQSFQLKVSSKHLISHPDRWVKTLDADKFAASVKQLHRHTLQLTPHWRPDRLHGTINMPKDKPLLFLSIPYDPGWQVSVDGRQQPIQRVAHNLSAVTLAPGHHKIRLTYITPGFRTGLVISLLAFATYAGLFWWDQRHQKHNATSSNPK